MSKPSAIAIDGPVASGKTTVGRLLARRLGYRFLDTGIMYRGVTWVAIARGIDTKAGAMLGELAASLRFEVVSCNENGDRLRVDGEDITHRLREPEVEKAVSLVSRIKRVREALVEKQRALAKEGGVVVVGRDIGTAVLPDAELKVFLLASVEERARRRHREQQNLGQETSYDRVVQEVLRRDKIDTERSHSPLQPASDAHLLNTEGIDMEEVVDRILAMVEKG